MSEILIRRTCTKCDGNGTLDFPPPVGTEDCPICDGNGYHELVTVAADDLFDKLDDIMDKCNDILEEVQGG